MLGLGVQGGVSRLPHLLQICVRQVYVGREILRVILQPPLEAGDEPVGGAASSRNGGDRRGVIARRGLVAPQETRGQDGRDGGHRQPQERPFGLECGHVSNAVNRCISSRRRRSLEGEDTWLRSNAGGGRSHAAVPLVAVNPAICWRFPESRPAVAASLRLRSPAFCCLTCHCWCHCLTCHCWCPT